MQIFIKKEGHKDPLRIIQFLLTIGIQQMYFE